MNSAVTYFKTELYIDANAHWHILKQRGLLNTLSPLRKAYFSGQKWPRVLDFDFFYRLVVFLSTMIFKETLTIAIQPGVNQ